MGTNFFAHIIPTKKRKKELQDAIKANDFHLITKLTSEMYDRIRKSWDSDDLDGGEVHLGKMSAGWKFLWNPNVYVVRHGHREDYQDAEGHSCTRWIEDPDTACYLYPLTKKGIKAFIDREDVEIYDEYGEKQDKEKFWNDAINWTTRRDRKTGKIREAWDGASYEEEYPNEHRWINNTELTQLLEAEGYKFTSETKSDFYSDGLRFSSSTDFY